MDNDRKAIDAENNNKNGQSRPECKVIKDALESIKVYLSDIEGKTPIPSEVIEELVGLVHVSREIFEEYSALILPEERRRLSGTGTKSYGFIEKACASAADNPQFLPPYLSVEKFQNDYGDVYRKRTLHQQVKLYEQQVGDSLLSSSNAAYHDALDYYNSLKDAARRNIPDAKELYDELKPYFIRPKQGGIIPLTD
ncbi:MAG: hypothetical protein LBS54_02130 [Dysgonamonadaceae bacterium]|jgi:hypothetical protein|nr:hypothetical protein [Dysgonamonadaceae bacterium]